MSRTGRLAAALATTLVLATAGSATADPSPSDRVVGGERLGQPDVQVSSGAPKLPDGLTGMSWLVADADTGDVLAAYRPHLRLPPASTLKMLFADVVLPKFPRDTVHRVMPEDLAGMGAGSSLVGVKEDLDYTVQDLWRGVFLPSGNDAVHVLAHMNGGVDQTVREMNQKARALGAADTEVVSPDGYDEDGQLSSAYDLTLFAREGLRNADFRSYCGTKDAQFPGAVDKATGQRASFGIQNTDRLLGKYPGLIGVKNGYTSNAGSTFVGAAQRDGRTLLVAVMHPDTYMKVYDETAALLDWGFAAGNQAHPIGTLVAPQPTPTPAPSAAASASPTTGRVPTVQASASNVRTVGAGDWAVIGAAALCASAAGWLLNRHRRRNAGQPATGEGAPPDEPGPGGGSTALRRR
ncbi:D-alanyl-D-alanine carboxypeptidase (penicillin-binding protein 5/6) [Kitasatospora sp. GP30]|uniref:D-alanyl-D-alanine carboxypeptidase family protein n=1 Tax=Kitasatospora sp. GP30 TaxID=3035084 RepID=UPI000CB07C88|nr:D-alanyl-D-alanine carboxypeptidase [Kitasatospora sp. GP30]MDH6140765.1 D-alanyl-D-alanine carboxypeptidase (penicillin-binding protein 5/6) [Kitasatospora sp. GP30]